MIHVETFQLYLLDRMRARDRVDGALRALGSTRAAASAARRDLVARGLDTPGHPAALYTALLGPSRARKAVRPELAGLTEHRFTLPLWPDLDFVVHEHQTGWAAAPFGFERGAERSAAPPIGSAADLTPWAVVLDEVEQQLGPGRSEDAWTDLEDRSFELPPSSGALPERFTLCFDFRLLQCVERR